MTGFEVVQRARALVGAPFRPQGRDPREGIDCVGLVLWVFGIPCSEVRRDYSLHGNESELQSELSRLLVRVEPSAAAAGDVLLCEPAPGRAHLAIASGASIIHADARLRRVAERPGKCPWPVIAAFRAVSNISAS